ncbi:uncharacterized protein Z519_10030 [Cladophialophora bantiana CBS 173.52]|uniref:Heterokaryon incompatibility domain-containing protein n=1 Tax=Cladophialophora bantiana (strain ATCC 10958 / CBS 173.52 / CDC B-1940 / NIH 8579) TaxID=1442370 RepID=A0A0D2H797_CLAB1|nr:uncharacterized protein Z519_10030 [Cladophialophora bantiana CBS 173.52]KIW89178.1 hypothetical protein Z519_10030 [Cladophialophora bantiana CBS 173.52]
MGEHNPIVHNDIAVRLLRRDSQNELSLTDDPDENIPYAILSHTWCPDHNEVTFADIEKS